MIQTIAAQEMVQALGEVTSDNDLATILDLAERFAQANGMPRIATVHIEAAMARLTTDTDGNMYQPQPPYDTDPMAPDYTALAAVEPTSQVEDCRDSAEVVG